MKALIQRHLNRRHRMTVRLLGQRDRAYESGDRLEDAVEKFLRDKDLDDLKTSLKRYQVEK